MNAEAACDRLAGRQHGVISREQALAAGLSSTAIERRVARGRWRRVQRGVFAVRSAPGSWLQDLMAAVLGGGAGTFASHRAAGALWGLDGISQTMVEVSMPSPRRLRDVRVHRRPSRDNPRVVNLKGISTSDARRTIIDLAAVVSAEQLSRALDDALQRLVTLGQLIQALEALGSKGRPGAAKLRSLLAQRDGGDEQVQSKLEGALLRLLRKSGLPLPVPQFEVALDATALARIDFAYPSARVGIETDGYRWHGGRGRWVKDLRRENRLKLLGWILLRFSWEDVHHRPQLVLQQIRAALQGTHLIHPALDGFGCQVVEVGGLP